MKKLQKIHRIALGTIVSLGVLAIGATAFIITTNVVGAKNPDWPALTMTYKTATTNPDTQQTNESTFRLTYTSDTEWKEEIIAAPTIQAGDDTYSEVGYYQQLSGDQYSVYDPITGTTETETVPDNVRRIPRSMLTALPISTLEGTLGKEAKAVPTSTRVCFEDDCTDNAPGWQYEDNGHVLILADDARGIPIKINNLTVDELTVHEAKEVIERSSDNSTEDPG